MASDKKEKTVKIGIDFGTTNSFAGILHGDRVMPLVAGKESFGYPSVFYYDGKQELTGSIALKRAALHPENAVISIKKKLTEREIVLGGRAFTPRQIVARIISYVVNSAEEMLEQQYFISYDEMEAVITVPVDFSNAEIEVIRRAAGDVKLKNGKRLQVTGVIAEPCAAAIEYFGMARNSTIGTGALVYDLGGGTFDVALVQKTENQAVPYEVVDQIGIHDLGGDDWDAVMEQLVQKKYKQEFNTEAIPTRVKKIIRANARGWKEELTENQVTTVYVDGEEEFETDVTNMNSRRYIW